MKYAYIAFAFSLIFAFGAVGLACADEPKAVTLTQGELSAYANAVQAQTAAQIAAGQAKPVLDKIRAAFAPTPPAKPDAPKPHE